MSDNAKRINQPKGRYGLILEATTARVYNQFSNIAMASLIYDFVAAEWIRGQIDYEVDGQSVPGIIVGISRALYENGLCIDPYDVVPLAPLPPDEATFREKYPGSTDDQWKFYQDFGKIYHAAHRLNEKKREKLKQTEDPKELDELVTEVDDMTQLTMSIEKSYHRFLFKLGISSKGFTIDDGGYLDDGVDDKFNSMLRPIVGSGHIPLLGCCSSDTAAIRKGETVKAMQLFVRAVPFPAELPIDEFVDFRNSKAVRNSIGEFRRLVDDLIGEQAPAQYLVDELMERYDAYKVEVKRLKSRTHLGTLKFIITNMAGAIEDVLKLRIESLAKRPFEIGEWIMDKRYSERTHDTSPFHFAAEMDIEASE